MPPNLTPKEREVIRIMRESQRAHDAIHSYAEAFLGDEQAVTVEKWSASYGEQYE